MSFNAEVLRVLIASPSDVAAERDEIEKCIFEWNSHYAENMNIVLLPARWERDVVPAYGESGAQDIINEQLVNKCDILIGVFWTKMGTPTHNASSGTLEEIDIFIQKNKEVMVYFLDKDIPRSFKHFSEIEKVDKFKKEYQHKGVYSKYNIGEISNHLYHKVGAYKKKASSLTVISTPPIPEVREDIDNIDSFFSVEDLILAGSLTRNELLVLDYMYDRQARSLGAMWKSTETLERMGLWKYEKYGDFPTFTRLDYADTLENLKARKMIEPVEYTAEGNIRMFSMPISIFQDLITLPLNTRMVIMDTIKRR